MARGHISTNLPVVGLYSLAFYVLTVLLAISFSTPVTALNYVTGSPCASQCASTDSSYENNTVCLDDSFRTGQAGAAFRECTTCLLNSTAVDQAGNRTDVEWGLFNLRYTLSECMFAYPAEIISISSPCQVTCGTLKSAMTYGIGSDPGTATVNTPPNLNFCNQYFDDNVLNNCSFCYSMIPQQVYLANFVQALHIACRDPPTAGQTFYPGGQAIFNETLIAGPAPVGSTGPTLKSEISGWRLAVIIIIPGIVVLAVLGTGCFCCYKFTKGRRDRMAAQGRMKNYHDQHQPYGDGQSAYEWQGQEQGEEMQHIQTVGYMAKHDGTQISPGLAQARYGEQAQHEEDVPLSASLQDDVGPGRGQNRDPFLHEQYFGAEAGPSSLPGQHTPMGSNRNSWQQR